MAKPPKLPFLSSVTITSLTRRQCLASFCNRCKRFSNTWHRYSISLTLKSMSVESDLDKSSKTKMVIKSLNLNYRTKFWMQELEALEAHSKLHTTSRNSWWATSLKTLITRNKILTIAIWSTTYRKAPIPRFSGILRWLTIRVTSFKAVKTICSRYSSTSLTTIKVWLRAVNTKTML